MSDVVKKLDYENIKLASIGKRSLAFLIDEIIIGSLFLAIYYDYFSQFGQYEEIVVAVSKLSLEYITIRTAYHTLFVWYYGATLGKMALKLACIEVSYLDKPNLGSSFLRAVVRNLSEWAFCLGFLWAFGNEARQTWHDKLAKTVVIDVA
ncbi:RDD family protein [Campylobacter mucosalis]|uniref:RDD family protein n=1 Tax=Campylobacter mucosalis TaxID=202 RepID=UPI00146FDB23|nr:RDD family protein [Campylobacter mucosalis]